jgi:hypothetical protein
MLVRRVGAWPLEVVGDGRWLLHAADEECAMPLPGGGWAVVGSKPESELVLVERDGNAMALVTRGEGVASESCDGYHETRARVVTSDLS